MAKSHLSRTVFSGGLTAALLVTFCPAAAGLCPVPICAVPCFDPCARPPLVGPPCLPTPAGVAAPVPAEPPAPVVTISVHVPAEVAVGRELTYRIVVQNRSVAPAHHVLVRNPLPAVAAFVRADPEPSDRAPDLIWKLGTLPPGERREIVLVLKPSGEGDVRSCARVQFEYGQVVDTRIARPALKVRKEGPVEAVVRDTLRYRLVVTNTGGADATGVRLTDSLAVGMEHASGNNALTWDFGAVGPGQSRSVEYQVTAKAAGRLCNRVAATADGGLREVVESCVNVTEAKLSLTAAGPAELYVNAAASYQFTVTNSGTAPLRQVALVAPLPEGMNFVSASPGGRRVGERVEWAIGPLGPGESRSVDLKLRARAPGKFCPKATATAERGLAVEAEACTNFVGVAALLLELVDTDDPVEVGAETKYVITVRNQGTAPATNVRVEALAPVQTDVVRVQGFSDHKKEGNKVLFVPFTLAAGKEVRFVVTVKAKAPGDVRFKVDLYADQLTSGKPVHEEESTTIYTDLPSGRASPPPGKGQGRRKPADAKSGL